MAYQKLRKNIYQWTPINWDDLLNSEDITGMWNTLSRKLIELCKKYIPMSSSSLNNRRVRPVWWQKECNGNNKAEKESIYTKMKFGNVDNRKVYAKVCNQVKWECRKAKRDYERVISANVKYNPKSFYKYARWKLKVPVIVGILKGKNGTVAQTDKEKAEALNVFIASVFTQEDTLVLPIFEIRAYNSTLTDFEISRDDI